MVLDEDAMVEVTIPYNFRPRSYQLPFLQAMDGGYNRAVCIWHRRSGKDKSFLNFMARKMWERVGSYYYFLPTAVQGRKIIWDGIDRDGFRFMDHFPEQLRRKTRNDEMKVTMKNGSIFQVIGTDNVDSIMGTNPIGCVFSEYSLQNPQAWDFIRPILLENEGWAVFNFTPRGRNHAYMLKTMAEHNPAWFYSLLTVDQTKRENGKPLLGPDDIQAERDAGMDEALVQQEYYCSFDALLDACFFGPSLARHKSAMPGKMGTLTRDQAGVPVFAENGKGNMELWRYPYCLLPTWDGIRWKKRYVIGSDISEGLRQDYSVAYVYDRVKHEMVARARTNTIDTVAWSKILIMLSEYYENALIVPERNGAGITVCKTLSDANANVYANEIPAKVGSGLTKVIGWQESQQAKYDICGDLKEYFHSTQGAVFDALLLSECSVFIKTETGRLEADEGFHDDCVIAAALALQGHYWLGTKPEKEEQPITGWRARIKREGESAWTA